METRKVIKSENLPARLPFFKTLTTILALDYWNAPGWLWGVIGTIIAIWWILSIAIRFKSKEIDIFDVSYFNMIKYTTKNSEEKFRQEKLKEAYKNEKNDSKS